MSEEWVGTEINGEDDVEGRIVSWYFKDSLNTICSKQEERDIYNIRPLFL